MVKNYCILRTVGEGSYSKVKLARDVRSGNEVAVKFLKKSRCLSPEVLSRETACMRMLEHPNIVSLIEVLETEREVIMVMEYVRGGDLLDYVVDHGPLREGEARELFRQLASAVRHCHLRGIAHRDLKPENILVEHQDKVKVTDFGLCKNFVGDPLCTLCGTPVYTAPEVIQGGNYGPEADIWSLGVVLYFMTTGRLPFPVEKFGKPYSNRYFHLPGKMSPALQHLLLNMIKFNPQRRIGWEEIMAHPWVASSALLPATAAVQPVTSGEALKRLPETRQPRCRSCPPAWPSSSCEDKAQKPRRKVPSRSASLPLKLEFSMATFSPVLWTAHGHSSRTNASDKGSSTNATLGTGDSSGASYPSSQRPGDSSFFSSSSSPSSSSSSSGQRPGDSTRPPSRWLPVRWGAARRRAVVLLRAVCCCLHTEAGGEGAATPPVAEEDAERRLRAEDGPRVQPEAPRHQSSRTQGLLGSRGSTGPGPGASAFAWWLLPAAVSSSLHSCVGGDARHRPVPEAPAPKGALGSQVGSNYSSKGLRLPGRLEPPERMESGDIGTCCLPPSSNPRAALYNKSITSLGTSSRASPPIFTSRSSTPPIPQPPLLDLDEGRSLDSRAPNTLAQYPAPAPPPGRPQVASSPRTCRAVAVAAQRWAPPLGARVSPDPSRRRPQAANRACACPGPALRQVGAQRPAGGAPRLELRPGVGGWGLGAPSRGTFPP
ncbi:serine/threonine-protein kinase MARK2-like [Erinaceus europaeus]|uniref:non-specific serine/threonine protein kinase n=1 Tax=Erinaceus europaeus TaxID=9365 RepID=A0ABM3WF60_ERIEU|nr:serine/threonine-protein kinase MARK2-like [Erinaceus europaeus]